MSSLSANSEMRGKIDEHVVTLSRRPSPEAEQYNTLRYALALAREDDPPRIIVVTSPGVGDGKTTTAVNLAGVLARRREARVLLIDADLRRPSVARLLGLASETNRAGFVDAILDPDLTFERAVTHLPALNLSVLTAGKLSSDDPFELLRTSRARDLLQEARRQYQFVVLDTSPLLLVPDTRLLDNWVDGFLLVVAAHVTPRKVVSEAVNLLNPSKLIGLVFNRDDRPLSGYSGYGYGYGYGHQSLSPDAPSGPQQWLRRSRSLLKSTRRGRSGDPSGAVEDPGGPSA